MPRKRRSDIGRRSRQTRNARNARKRLLQDNNTKQKWINTINGIDWQPKKHNRICSAHFWEEYIDCTLCRVHIQDGTVPTNFEGFLEEFKMPRMKRKSNKSKQNELKGAAYLRKEKARLRQQKFRAAETPEARSRRRKKDAMLKAKIRAAETPEERSRRRKKDVMRKAKIRAAETPEQRSRRRKKDVMLKAKNRAGETTNQGFLRQVKNVQPMAMKNSAVVQDPTEQLDLLDMIEIVETVIKEEVLEPEEENPTSIDSVLSLLEATVEDVPSAGDATFYGQFETVYSTPDPVKMEFDDNPTSSRAESLPSIKQEPQDVEEESEREDGLK